MKNIIAIVSLLLCGSTLFAQDIITKKDGTDIQAKVTEVSNSQIVFKKFSNLDGPSYKMDVADILMITYENGEREMFNVETAKSDIPETLRNDGRNEYYAIPLLLGIVGLLYHIKRDSRGASVVGLLFLIMHWPGANLMLIVGISLLILDIPVLIWLFRLIKNHKKRTPRKR